MAYRHITEKDRKIWRQNALRGTAKTRGKKRSEVPKAKKKWGFIKFGTNTVDRSRKSGNEAPQKAYTIKKKGKEYGMVIRYFPDIRYDVPKGKKFFTVDILERGKPNTDSNSTFYQIDATDFADAKKQALKMFKR